MAEREDPPYMWRAPFHRMESWAKKMEKGF